MEVLLGYILGVGTVVTLVKRGDKARGAVAWAARHIGALSGKLSHAIEETSRVAREEYEQGRAKQLSVPAERRFGEIFEKSNGASEGANRHVVSG